LPCAVANATSVPAVTHRSEKLKTRGSAGRS
jgi:hypothetical protein